MISGTPAPALSTGRWRTRSAGIQAALGVKHFLSDLEYLVPANATRAAATTAAHAVPALAAVLAAADSAHMSRTNTFPVMTNTLCLAPAQGPCRFVVPGQGAILEAVGAFDSLRESKPGLATVSNDDNSFECHIRLEKVKTAQFARKETADGRTLHVVRLLSADADMLLSAILHPEVDGEVDEGAIEFWESLRSRFGDDVELVADDEE